MNVNRNRLIKLGMIGVCILFFSGFDWPKFPKKQKELWIKVGAILTIKTPHHGASVWIDGRLYGRAPVAPVFLSEGSHLIELRGYQSRWVMHRIQLKAGHSQTLRLTFSSSPPPPRLHSSLSTLSSALWPINHREVIPSSQSFRPFAQLSFQSNLTSFNHSLPSSSAHFFQGNLTFQVRTSKEWQTAFALTSRYRQRRVRRNQALLPKSLGR